MFLSGLDDRPAVGALEIGGSRHVGRAVEGINGRLRGDGEGEHGW